MPELPEVQTVVDTLAGQIRDREIIKIEVIYAPIIEDDISLFKEKLIGQHFRNFRRRGKYLLFEMDDLTLVSHLRMEGKYYLYEEGHPLSKHDHIVFYLDDGRRLVYNDFRKFGRMYLTDKKRDYRSFKDLGPEPFWDSFNEEYCKTYLAKHSAPIKEVLLDQHFVAGIGNIYADEILYACKIFPKRRADSLSDKEIEDLIKNTRKILRKAIRAGGTTIRTYTSSLGVTGRFQMSLRAHEQKICPVCKGEIRKITVAGRGTYFCPVCQKENV